MAPSDRRGVIGQCAGAARCGPGGSLRGQAWSLADGTTRTRPLRVEPSLGGTRRHHLSRHRTEMQAHTARRRKNRGP